MPIQNTQKRIIQISVVTLLVIIAVAGLYGYRHYQTEVVGPQAFLERLIRVAKGDIALSASDYDHESIAGPVAEQVLAQLEEDLSAVSRLDASAGAGLLVADATVFLADTAQFEPWLTEQLNLLWQENDDWQIERQESSIYINTGKSCLQLADPSGHWQLTAITDCTLP